MNFCEQVSLSNYKLHAETFGQENQPGILFLHGFLGAGQDWQKIIKTLSRHFFCVTLDLPGHGKTCEGDDWIFSMPHIAWAVGDYLSRWPRKTWTVVGYSMGGRLGLFLSLYYPHLFDKGILLSASPGLVHEKERQERSVLDENWASMLEQDGLDVFLDKWYQQPLFQSMREHTDLARLKESRLQNDPPRLAKSLRLMGLAKQESLWPLLGGCQVPLQFVCGARDLKFVEMNRRMLGLCKQASLAIIADCGHNLLWEAPEQIAQTLWQFLKREPPC